MSCSCIELLKTQVRTASLWVDGHWQCAAAELEAGLLDDDGNRVPGACWRSGLAAYQERLFVATKNAIGSVILEYTAHLPGAPKPEEIVDIAIQRAGRPQV